ncbi:hypothetical protein G6F50_015611 [Rhizopus delemar]|uniref:Uncharacterized protein n=1 Tax=Rhizopus delemar TaxID=936053 RepID=A0A9P6XWU3_9FUNG|nr:hypothetical protein G6F50_015611 [Rhizopus delemar]
MPDLREAQGKPRMGHVRLSAQQEGDYVSIEVQDDGAGFEQDLSAVLPGRKLPNWIPCEVGGRLHLGEGQQLHVVGHAQFFQRPAHAHGAGQALAAIGGGGEGSEDGTHREAPAGRRAWLQVFRRTTAPGIDIRSSACTSHARALYAGTDSDPSRWRGHPQKQRNVLMAALAAVLVIVLVILFIPW